MRTYTFFQKNSIKIQTSLLLHLGECDLEIVLIVVYLNQDEDIYSSLGVFSTLNPFFEAGRWFLNEVARTQTRWRRSPIENFWKKVVYSFLLRFKIQDENIYSILGVFFNIWPIFWLSDHLWNGREKFHPPKWRRERPVRSRARFKKVMCPFLMCSSQEWQSE